MIALVPFLSLWHGIGQLPGAKLVFSVANPAIQSKLRSDRSLDLRSHLLISDDGKWLYIFDGKLQRYSLSGNQASGRESIFYLSDKKKGELFSATTSQFARMPVSTQKAISDWSALNVRLFHAPDNRIIVLGSVIERRGQFGVLLSAVDLSARGSRPNRDVSVTPRVGTASNPVKPMDGKRERVPTVVWLVQDMTYAKDDVIDQYTIRMGPRPGAGIKKNALSVPRLAYADYDPKGRRLLSVDSDLGKLAMFELSKKKTSWIELPNGATDVFASRGTIFAQSAVTESPPSLFRWSPQASRWDHLGEYRVRARNRAGDMWVVEKGRERSLQFVRF